jgi:hypothetical protein
VRYALAAAGACLALAACGDDSKPDPAEVARELGQQVAEQTGTPDVRVNCPDDVAVGDLCDVAAAGGVRAKVKVVQLEDSDVKGELVQP